MKMTNAEIGAYLDVMANLHETGKLGYAIAKNTRKMTDAAKEYLDLRNQLFQKYGTVNGKLASITGENVPKYTAEMGDIPQETEDIDVYTVDEATFCSGHLTSDQMTSLLWMVKEG